MGWENGPDGVRHGPTRAYILKIRRKQSKIGSFGREMGGKWLKMVLRP